MTAASSAFIQNAITSAPRNMPGARSIIRSPIIIRFCTCWISFVRRVTSDPVLNVSIFLNENCCTLANKSRRRSLVKEIDAFAAKYAPRMPPAAIKKEVIAITSPILRMYPPSFCATPWLIIIDINLGSRISPSTSVTIMSGPRIKALLYGSIYDLYRFHCFTLFPPARYFCKFFMDSVQTAPSVHSGSNRPVKPFPLKPPAPPAQVSHSAASKDFLLSYPLRSVCIP